MTARKMTTVRLNSQTLATLRELRERHGLSSDAAAIEYLAAVYRDRNKNKEKKKVMNQETNILENNDYLHELYVGNDYLGFKTIPDLINSVKEKTTRGDRYWVGVDMHGNVTVYVNCDVGSGARYRIVDDNIVDTLQNLIDYLK